MTKLIVDGNHGAAWPVKELLRHFRREIGRRINEDPANQHPIRGSEDDSASAR